MLVLTGRLWVVIPGRSHRFSRLLRSLGKPWSSISLILGASTWDTIAMVSVGDGKTIGVGCPMEEAEVVIDSNLVEDLETGTGNRGIMGDKILI